MKTSKKDFDEYKKWCLYYMDKFKLDDWQIYFELGELNSIAKCATNVGNRNVTFALTKELEELSTQSSMKSNARHEVCHVLIAELDILIANHCTEDEQKMANERLTCKLSNLFKDF